MSRILFLTCHAWFFIYSHQNRKVTANPQQTISLIFHFLLIITSSMRSKPLLVGFSAAFFFLSFFLFSFPSESQVFMQDVLQDVLVCAGDSITVGYPYCDGKTAEGCICEGCYVPRVMALSGIPTVNEGFIYSETVYERYMIDYYLSQYKPKILTIYSGNNDIQYNTRAQDVGIAINNLTYVVDRCLAYGTRPVIATLGPQFGQWAWRQPYILQINQGIRQLAASRGISVADIGSALWNQEQYFTSDGIHPNLAGHDVIANLFYRAINRCAYDISPLSVSFKHSGGTGSVSVTTGTGSLCSWTAASNEDWIVVTEASSGTGSGLVSYQISLNSSGKERTGTLTVAGKILTIFQEKAVALNFLDLLLAE